MPIKSELDSCRASTYSFPLHRNFSSNTYPAAGIKRRTLKSVVIFTLPLVGRQLSELHDIPIGIRFFPHFSQFNRSNTTIIIPPTNRLYSFSYELSSSTTCAASYLTSRYCNYPQWNLLQVRHLFTPAKSVRQTRGRPLLQSLLILPRDAVKQQRQQ